MARNGNGQYTLPAGNPVVPGTTISTDWANNTLNDIATALTGSVASDGQTAMQGNLDMSNNKIVGLTNGTNPQDAATVNQLSNAAITGGTINGASIGITNPKDGNFLNLTANTGDFSAGLTAVTVTPPSDSSNKVATTEFVQEAIAAVSSGVTSFNGRSGVVTLQGTDVTTALGYTPYNAGTSTVVTSTNVLDYTVGKTGQGATGTWGISISGNAATANSANSVDTITSNQVSTALGYVPLTPNSPALLGTPTAPTATVGTNTTQIATCAFVLANQGGGGGAVSSVNGKTGAVTLNAADVGAYASNNPSGFTTLAAVQAQGYTTLAIVQSQGYQTSTQVTATLQNYTTLNTAQTLSAIKTFTNGIHIQSASYPIFVTGGNALSLGGFIFTQANATVPSTDNGANLGIAQFRWAQVFAAVGTINTSDKNQKTEIRDISEVEKRVAIKCKGLIKSFKFTEATYKKGVDGARIHFGVMAQEVGEAFLSEGLDPNDYALYCFDEWVADPERNLTAGSSYGIRYDELLSFIIAAM